DEYGNTALHKACSQGSKECVKHLLTHGASVHCVNKAGKLPFDIAYEKLDQETCNLL
ncbi:hypothetical protein GUITHDRAFT_62077, partial [Guillardia theta CCMP2712]